MLRVPRTAQGHALPWLQGFQVVSVHFLRVKIHRFGQINHRRVWWAAKWNKWRRKRAGEELPALWKQFDTWFIYKNHIRIITVRFINNLQIGMNMYEFISYNWWTLAPAISITFPGHLKQVFHRVSPGAEAHWGTVHRAQQVWSLETRPLGSRAGPGWWAWHHRGWTSFERCPTSFRTFLPSGYDIHRNSHGKILSFLRTVNR